jgi:hypothetical protein
LTLVSVRGKTEGLKYKEGVTERVRN